MSPSPPADPDDPITLVRTSISRRLSTPYTYHDTPIFRLLHIHSASLTPHPSVTSRLTIPQSLTNPLGVLHGGATALIFDVCTTLPFMLIRDEGKAYWGALGVSRNLSVTFLEGVREGEEVEVEAEMVGLGARLGSLRGTMRRVEEPGGRPGKVLATCEHGKVNVDKKAKL